MAERPPDDPSLPWEEIARQVQIALEELPIGNPESKGKLMEDLKSVMVSLEEFGLPFGMVPPRENRPAPDISVVAGGREAETEEAEPETEPEEESVLPGRPDLKVAPDPITEEEEIEDSGEASGPGGGFNWFNLGDLGKSFPLPGMTASPPGDIRLSGADAEEGVQTLYTGTQARPYRIHCADGAMRVVVDGKSGEVLRASRSIDVEGTLIRVMLEDGSSAMGTFQRIS
jgi:hypothetical protein